MRHDQWKGITRTVAVWHADPHFEEFMRHLIRSVKPSRFIETGTQMGWTCGWIAENFPDLPIFTVEKDDEFYQLASENLASYPSVSLEKGDSREFIKEICGSMHQDDKPLFWLDAHSFSPYPLQDECRSVVTLDRYACVIDDFILENPPFDGDVFYEPDGVTKSPNDIHYVGDILGRHYWRPTYQSQPGYRGYALFLKNIDYTPPSTLGEMK